MSSRIIIISKGSFGDINPYIAIGHALRARGHEVFFIATNHFRMAIEEAGLTFLSMGKEEEYQHLLDDSRTRHPRKVFELLVRDLFLSKLSENLEMIRGLYRKGNTVIVAHATAPEGRLAHEIFGIPTLICLLQPAWIRSPISPPKTGLNIPRMGRLGNRAMYYLVDRALLDPHFRALNEARQTYGLAPVKRFLKEWWLGVDIVLGLFPEWFAPRKRDWPKHFSYAGFVLCDGSTKEETPERVWDAMLKEYGDAQPVVFTTGTPFAHEQRFFQIAVDACRTLDRPGILLTPHHSQVPASLPENVRHFSFVPFSKIFPRVFCVAHHGGINTVAACFNAGVPQIVVPTYGGFDQVDNAHRVAELGVGAVLSRKSLTSQRLVDAICEAPRYKSACAVVKERMQESAQNTLPAICLAVEGLIGRDVGRV